MTSPLEAPITGLAPNATVHPGGPHPDHAMLDRLLALGDLSATVSDVLDALGFETSIGASTLRPAIEGRRIVGRAVTVRKVPQRQAQALGARNAEADLGEVEGVNQGRPGDVLVIEGQADVSAMGGLVSDMAQRQGLVGAVVGGGVRDVGHARSIGFPTWSTHITPKTGKWRSVVVEINGPVTIAGTVVQPGDIIVADETGVCAIPAAALGQVVETAEAINVRETRLRDLLASSSAPLHELVGKPAKPVP